VLECEAVAEFRSEKRKGRDHLKELNVDGSIILRWSFEKFRGRL
jgi:hypothetical protein